MRRRTKRKLLYIAAALLFLLGCSQVTKEDLVDISSSSKQTFYAIFDIKEDDSEQENVEDSNITSFMTEVEMRRVVDGDTIIVADRYGKELTVRMIGIDTPESVNPDETKNNEYGEMASDYTKELLQDIKKVYLQFDEQNEDKYGRTLAYVWLYSQVDVSDTDDIKNYMLNAMLVKDGYAYDKVYEPNKHYAGIFETLRIDSQEQGAGLWKYDDFATLW